MYMYGYFATGAVDYQWHLCVSMLCCSNFGYWNLIGMYHL